MSAKCHVCGTREPESPSVAHPICHSCRNAIWPRTHRTDAELLEEKRDVTEIMYQCVVRLRRIEAARHGVASLSTFHPPPNLARSSQAT